MTILGCALAVSALFLLSGCGGESETTVSGMTPEEAKAAITENWETFFDGTTPAAKRVTLLENGDEFEDAMDAIENSALAKRANASVTDVTIDGPTTATVTYSLLLGETPVLEGIEGTAVFVDGVWQVSTSSFCELAALQGTVPEACPPANG